MNVPAKQSRAPHAATDDVQILPPEEVVTQPKVARRPTQWKPVVTATAQHTTTNRFLPSVLPRNATPWQEDAQFGIWLVVVIVLLNVGLIRLGDTTEKADPAPSIMVQQVTRPSVLPTPISGQSPNVHMFATPERERRVIRQTTLNGIEEDLPVLNEIPAPRAILSESFDD